MRHPRASGWIGAVLAVSRKALAVAALAAVGLGAALLLARTGGAADVTTTLGDVSVTQTVTETTAETQTATVQETVTATVPAVSPVTTTTPEENTSSGTSTWVWVAVGLAALALVLLIVWLAGRGLRRQLPVEARQQRVFTAVQLWTAKGWMLERETPDSAVLSRGNEIVLLTVDAYGNVNAGPLPGPGRSAPTA
jgi:hypothetical protein